MVSSSDDSELETAEKVKIEVLYEMFSNIEPKSIDKIVALCNKKKERALQVLLCGIDTARLLNLLRFNVMKSVVKKVEIDQAHLQDAIRI